jgi:hypothetical protein
MPTRNSRNGSSFVFAAVFAILSTGAFAQDPGNPGNQPVFAKLSDAAIAQFKADPQALLTTYASAGLPLATEVRSLLLTDPSLIGSLIAVAKNGNGAQQAAIGAGLAQASRSLARTNPQLATTIQQQVAQSGLSPLITAYIAASGQIETAAIGAGGAGAGGTGGAVGGLSANGGANGGSNPGANSFSTPNSATGFSNSSSANGGATVTTTTAVSPSI